MASALYTNLPSLSRSICNSAVVFGRRGRIPYDKRNWPTTDRHINENTTRGNKEYAEEFRREAFKYGMGPQPQGYMKNGTIVKISEIIPEYIVPDLTGCELKPYVPYNVEEITQLDFTAKYLFDATYGKRISDLYSTRKITVDDVPDVVEKYGKETDLKTT